ncbi:MAG: TRZ/ATZ family protein [Deltaproteobacteria bacterium]|nr:TRZ/ATZ family protein [Deltaproteobacteria bacterium]
MTKRIILPLQNAAELKAGEEVLLCGELIGARDQAHQRMLALLNSGRELPFSLAGAVIYYVGPAPTPPGKVIGSAGPTTAGRMDVFTPALLDAGLKGMVGKGNRSLEVVEAMRRNVAVYFYASGGCGALYAQCIKRAEPIAFTDLGPEAVFRLVVEDFPVIVAIDSQGRSVFA